MHELRAPGSAFRSCGGGVSQSRRGPELWLPIGLHSGWIFASALFNKIAHRELVALPWLGKSLLIGLVPLGVALITWVIVRVWLRNVQTPQS